jgi:Nicotinamide mononucleotide transporter
MNALEIAGFVTGALSVWLAARQNPWNWPIGVANAVCFLVLCWQSRLRRHGAGGALHRALPCSVGIAGSMAARGIHACASYTSPLQRQSSMHASGASASAIFAPYQRSIGDASPWLDALITVLSARHSVRSGRHPGRRVVPPLDARALRRRALEEVCSDAPRVGRSRRAAGECGATARRAVVVIIAALQHRSTSRRRRAQGETRAERNSSNCAIRARTRSRPSHARTSNSPGLCVRPVTATRVA